MSDKIARLGIERDNDLMYYIKNGDVWAVPRKQPGRPKGHAEKVASTNLELDYSRYIYFLDGDGDVARKERAHGGQRRGTKAKAAKASRPSRVTPKRAPRAGKRRSAQLERDIKETLGKKRGSGKARRG